VIANGTVVTSQGAGAWDIGIKGEQIVALGLPGSLPREGARVIDAAARSWCRAASTRTRTWPTPS
jgi:dihydroorotase-like cyclic amidohydrolase